MKMRMILPDNTTPLLRYEIAEGITAFSQIRDAELPFPITQAHQIHSDRIAIIDRPGLTREDLEGYDALMTDKPGIAIAARTADCVPVLLYDPAHKAIAAIHSGWKGTVKKIAATTIKRMASQYGTAPTDLLAIIGPSIGPDSFQIGQEVAEAFEAEGFPMDQILSDRGPKIPGTMQGGLHIDLWKANEWILKEAGIQPGNILTAAIDTYQDERFYSARREGISCGRIINTIMLR